MGTTENKIDLLVGGQSGEIWHCSLDRETGLLNLRGATAAAEAGTGSVPVRRTATTTLHPGSGPRHIVVGPDGVSYVINELSCTVAVLKQHRDGSMNVVQELETVTSAPAGSTAAEIQIHPSGHYVYLSTRGADCLTVFSRDPQTGLLVLEGTCRVCRTPRHFVIENGGEWCLVGGKGQNEVTSYRIDRDTGLIGDVVSTIAVDQPTCVMLFE